jgi:hypothetical protein
MRAQSGSKGGIVDRLPPLKQLGRAAAIVAVAVVPVAMTWWLVAGRTATALYLGMTFMTVAVVRLPLAEQYAVGFSAGLAAALGSLVAGRTPLLLAAVVAACAVQWLFNRRSVGVAALLPANLVVYATFDPGSPERVAMATWVGAAVVIVVGALARMRTPAEPAPDREGLLHAAELALGCVFLILLASAFGLPRGTWAVLTLCLVLVPAADQTRALITWRVLGTVTGALCAVAVAFVAPPAVGLALAVVCAVLTVAYALMPDELLYSVLLTVTVLLMFSSGSPRAAFGVALQRLEMTALGAGVALLLDLTATRWLSRRRAAEPGDR